MKSFGTKLILMAFSWSVSHTRVYCYSQRPSSSPSSSSSNAQKQSTLSTWDEILRWNDIRPPHRLVQKILRSENRWAALESVRKFRGGARNSRTKPIISKNCDDVEVQASNDPLDEMLRSVSLWLAGIVWWQTIATLLSHNEFLLHELADRLLSPESAIAVKMIRKIVKQFKDHGVIDIFHLYPTKDILASILALGKLQSASAYYEDLKAPKSKDVDPKVVQDLAHYSLYASAAYGWTMEAALGWRLHMGNLRALLAKTGINAEDVVKAAWESKTHRPSYFIVRDKKYKTIVLAIRGTLSARDVLTDLCATAETYETGCEGIHRAHHGMLQAARRVAAETIDCINEELTLHEDYSLVLVGHSLGSGVAAVLGTLWESKFPDLVVYGYGSPCVGPIDARPTRCDNIISVLGEGDPFSTLSLGHIADISTGVALLCDDDELRNVIRLRTDGTVDQMSDEDLEWCAQTMAKLRQSLTSERMYPPGRTLFIKRAADNNVVLTDVAHARFTDLRLHARMLDVSRHVPSLYESLLQELAHTSLK